MEAVILYAFCSLLAGLVCCGPQESKVIGPTYFYLWLHPRQPRCSYHLPDGNFMQKAFTRKRWQQPSEPPSWPSQHLRDAIPCGEFAFVLSTLRAGLPVTVIYLYAVLPRILCLGWSAQRETEALTRPAETRSRISLVPTWFP